MPFVEGHCLGCDCADEYDSSS